MRPAPLSQASSAASQSSRNVLPPFSPTLAPRALFPHTTHVKQHHSFRTTIVMSFLPVNNSTRWQPQKMAWWYWDLLDYMIANPQATKKEIALHYGIAYQTMILVTTSDMFNAHLEQRRAIISKQLDGEIANRLGKVALTAIDLTQDVLDKKRDNIPLDSLTDIMDKALTRLGYGVKGTAPSSGVTVNVQQAVVAPISGADLEEGRKLLRASQEQRRQAISVVDGLRDLPTWSGASEEGGLSETSSSTLVSNREEE